MVDLVNCLTKEQVSDTTNNLSKAAELTELAWRHLTDSSYTV